MKLPCNPAIPLLGICPDKTVIKKETCTPIFIAALFAIAKKWKQWKCPPTDEWVTILCCIYIVEYYSDLKNAICSNMDGRRD